MLGRLVGAERGLRLVLQRGWAPGQVQACAGGQLPDGRLLGGAGQELLALWEERGSEHTIQVAHCGFCCTLQCSASVHAVFLVLSRLSAVSGGTCKACSAARNGPWEEQSCKCILEVHRWQH